MSLLWPETITAGLFPGASWLQRGRDIARVAVEPHAGPQQLLAALEALLAAPEKPLRKGTRVRLLVSDSVAAVTVLPWQDLLETQDELGSYARSHFGQQGLQIGEDWALHTGFRHFRSEGLAYALPQQWLEAVVELLGGRGMRLESALPVSAAAYWQMDSARASAPPGLLLLREHGRLTALVQQGRRLLGTDVQPVAGGESHALARLLRRIAAVHPTVARVDTWCAAGDGFAEEAVAACFPDAQLRALPHRCWS